MRTLFTMLALLCALAAPSFAGDTWFEFTQNSYGIVVLADTAIPANAVHVAVQYRVAGALQSQVVSMIAMRGPLGVTGYTAAVAFPAPPGAVVELVQVVPVTLHQPGAQKQNPVPGVRY